jgi:hypothetical protein
VNLNTCFTTSPSFISPKSNSDSANKNFAMLAVSASAVESGSGAVSSWSFLALFSQAMHNNKLMNEMRSGRILSEYLGGKINQNDEVNKMVK